ncbi:MAG: M81 family metallopeptidase [Pararhodobacter sp.]|nr:M81 family metallopeptidase [Pararhodobacter sp.]
MTRPLRLAVARLWYEANSFNPLAQRLSAFEAREWVKGAPATALYAGTATEMGAVVAFAQQNPGWQIEYLRCTSAPPGGPVEQADLDRIIAEIVEGVSAGPWDAVYLSLHGALIGTADLSPDHTLLARVRAEIGPDVPLAASFDMHACLNPAIAPLLNVMTIYRTYPHVDMFETAERALTLLRRTVEGSARPAVTLHPVPMLPPSHNMRTDHGPMAELLELAQHENAPGLHHIDLAGGFAFADTPHAHACIALCHEAGVDAVTTADRLAAAALARHGAFIPGLPGPDEGLDQAFAELAAGTRWPVAVIDAADNPMSGGIGDTTAVLHALIARQSDLPVVFAFFHDPALVDRAHELGEGSAISAQLGGCIAPVFGAPVQFHGTITRLTDGRFRNTGPMERGMPVNLGRTAVLQSGALQIVISETCQSANDPGWCDLHGIDLSQTALFCVKAKNHFRASFAPLCGALITIDAPGAAPANQGLLRYRHVPAHYLTPQDITP